MFFESRNDFTGCAPPSPQTDNYRYRSLVISPHAHLTLTHPPTLWRAQEGERFIAAVTLAESDTSVFNPRIRRAHVLLLFAGMLMVEVELSRKVWGGTRTNANTSD